MMDRRTSLYHLGGYFLGLACCGCRSAPMTGRRQLMLTPEKTEIALGLEAYQQVTQETPLSTNAQRIGVVERVGKKIAAVARRADYQWEFRLLDTPEQNAFALPGGKVAIHEGLLPVCQNEAGLAVVMSHEVAHALARHGGERMSQQYAVHGVQQAVGVVFAKAEQAQRDRILQVYGAASKYGVILPYSRKQESEADHIGLMLMAEAGYDPEEAPRFWQRFASVKDAQNQPPEFMSTHPSDQRRAENLLALLPEAQQLYQQAPLRMGLGSQLT